MLQNFRLLKTGVDVAPLLAALSRKPELFDQITARQTTPGSPHHSTRAIFLRWSKDLTVEAAFNDLEAVDYPALAELPEALPLILQVLQAAESVKLGRVLITELAAGGSIDLHFDDGAVADHYERFHMALTSEAGNWFYCAFPTGGAEVVQMPPGSVFWFNHKRMHWVVNHSAKPRLHLIVDCVAPEYRRERDALSA